MRAGARSPRYKLARLSRAEAVVPEWDALCTSVFQRRDFLDLLERYNPCGQRYYELRAVDGPLVAGGVVYDLPLDLFTYRRVRSRVPITFVGVPCSQSAPGLVGEPAAVRALARRLLLEEPRFVVGLNLDHPLDVDGYVEGRNLPTVALERSFDSFDDYLAALRAPYRRRLRRIMESFDDVEVERLPCAAFDQEMHALYLEVFERCESKLERLSLDLFTHLPEAFSLTAYRRGGKLIGWHVNLVDGDQLAFFMGGHPSSGDAPGVYFYLLSGVLREAIEVGAGRIDLGQTAEVPKMRLGGRLVEKVMVGSHPWRAARALLRLGRPLVEYRRRLPAVHVFKEPQDGESET